jgi:hypothetical protein
VTLEEYRTKPAWQAYERLLVDKGWCPYWDPVVEDLVATAAIACPRCAQQPAYVGMRRGDLTLAFVVCREPCGGWAWFRPPTDGRPTPQGGEASP